MEAPVASQDDNGNGDILAVNDDNAVGNGPTTPVASRALIQEGATGSTTPTRKRSSLLVAASRLFTHSLLLISRAWAGPSQPQPWLSGPAPGAGVYGDGRETPI